MILTSVPVGAQWTCLARRGMLMSETEAIEYHVLDQGAGLAFVPQHGVDEAIVLLAGNATLAGQKLETGQLALVPQGTAAHLTMTRSGTLLSIRILPDRIARQLPPRIPELPVDDRTI